MIYSRELGAITKKDSDITEEEWKKILCVVESSLISAGLTVSILMNSSNFNTINVLIGEQDGKND